MNTILNSCGKEVFRISPIEQLRRFMFLGTEAGTYYISERDLTKMNLECLESVLQDEGDRGKILDLVKEFSNKAFKKDYIILVLARCCSFREDTEFRKSAYSVMLDVCKIPTHLFLFLELCEMFNKKYNNSSGWNKIHKGFICLWYIMKPLKELVYQCTKYKNRNGWTHRDVFRLCHIKPLDTMYENIYGYFVNGKIETINYENNINIDNRAIQYLIEYDKLKNTEDKEFAIEMIKKWNFVREHIPSTLIKDVDVLNELSQNMPIIALVRNLNRLTLYGVFDKYPKTLLKIVQHLKDKEFIRNTGVHPLQFLIALKIYSSGKGDLGNLQWKPIRDIVQALESAFYSSFENVEKTNKRYLLALDVSGSMSCCGNVSGINCLCSSEISCAMAMVIKSAEKNCDIMGFAQRFKELDITPEISLENNLERISYLSFGATDISLPFLWARENNKVYDVIIVFTDNETNCNTLKPSAALNIYREKVSPSAKLIVIATSANNFSIADPTDKGMLDIAGFNADTPNVINEFISL
jgi:60 kDa SS-A/Ro ribonucleoprotein